jgi:serine/threonine-protein kinase RsbW
MVPVRLEGAGEAQGLRGSEDLVLEIAPEPEHVRTARLFAAAAARHFNIDEEKVDDLKVAISEACTNSFRAHHAAHVSDPVVVVASPSDGGVRFSVIDAGKGFEPDAGSSDLEKTPPGGLFEGSLGLTLIRTLFPDVEMKRNSNRGMTVSFVVAVGEAL